jgi:hypothetical protein
MDFFNLDNTLPSYRYLELTDRSVQWRRGISSVLYKLNLQKENSVKGL